MEIERGLIKISIGYIHYRVAGPAQGKPIILLHVNGQSSAMYLELMKVLGMELHTFALDHPSCGMSDHITGHPTMDDYARYVTEVMDGLGVEKASFLGESRGAFLSVTMANAYPDRVEKIILVNHPFYPNKEFARVRFDDLMSRSPTDASGFPVTRTLADLENNLENTPMHPTQSWMDRLNVGRVEAGRDQWQVVPAVVEYDWPRNLARIQCPVLLIWGEHNSYLRVRDEFTRRIKNHQELIVKGGRHGVHWEFPEEVGQATFKFLKA